MTYSKWGGICPGNMSEEHVQGSKCPALALSGPLLFQIWATSSCGPVDTQVHYRLYNGKHAIFKCFKPGKCEAKILYVLFFRCCVKENVGQMHYTRLSYYNITTYHVIELFIITHKFTGPMYSVHTFTSWKSWTTRISRSTRNSWQSLKK